MGLPGQPPPYATDGTLMASMRAPDIDRANRSGEDGDEMRDEPASTRHSGWLVGLLAILGIAALAIVLYFVGIL